LICLAKGKAVRPQETVPPIHRVPANAVIGRALEGHHAGRGIDKAMHFCQKESEEMIKKAKESNGWCYF